MALVPEADVTVAPTVIPESGPGGETTVIDVSLATLKAAAAPPKWTAGAPVKLTPAIVTDVPTSAEPRLGLTLETRGVGTNVNRSLAFWALVPPEFVTVTSTVPGGTAGVIAVIEVLLMTVKLAAAVDPKLTALTPV